MEQQSDGRYKNGPYKTTGIDCDRPIYRIHTFRGVRDDLLRGKLTLRSPSQWDDAYEDPIRNCGFHFQQDGTWTQCFWNEDRRLPVFAQCWTWLDESDALWRIYSHPEHKRDLLGDDEGFRLRSTPRKLAKALADAPEALRCSCCYIGEVRYLNRTALHEAIASRIGAERQDAFCTVQGRVDACLLKRDVFSHEQEVRLIYVDEDRRSSSAPITPCFQNGQLTVTVRASDFVEEITLDPRLRPEQEQLRREALKSMGFQGPIRMSELYRATLLAVYEKPIPPPKQE
jgi:hypothetical protein